MGEKSIEDTDKVVLNIVNNVLEIDMTEVAIDCTHRIGDPKKKRKKARPIIAKFDRYYDRKEVSAKKKHLKGKGISITESLTSFRMKKLKRKMVLNMSGQSMVVSCLKMEMISQVYVMVNWLKHHGKRIHSFISVICDVISYWSNFLI